VVFKDDLKDPTRQVILPQLEFLEDPHFKVRVQILYSLSQFNCINEEIIAMTMKCIDDPSAVVRREAAETLTSFGISSKIDLEHAMKKIGILIGISYIYIKFKS
jgi:HEAT repeat protein